MNKELIEKQRKELDRMAEETCDRTSVVTEAQKMERGSERQPASEMMWSVFLCVNLKNFLRQILLFLLIRGIISA